MTVREYLTFVAKIKGVPRREVASRVDSSMTKTRVADMAGRHCSKLSKGYRQRVGLAQAILHNPDVLILDEPTAGLDPKQIIETRQLIRDLSGSHTIVLSTHILPEVSQTCQRVVIINKGKMVAVDSPDNLTARLRGTETIYLQVAAPLEDVPAALSALDGITRVETTPARDGLVDVHIDHTSGRDVRREVAAAGVNRGWGLLELRALKMSLEDVFLSLTTDETAAPAGDALPPAPESQEVAHA